MNAGKKPLRLLLVEDDEDDYLLTREVLADLPDTECMLDWVTTYEAALESAAQRKHDVYLVDYRLGAFNGLELVREMIARGFTAPIIVLTGEADSRVGAAAMAAGAADYLVKNEINAALLDRSLRYARERTRRSDLRDQKTANAERTRMSALIMEAPNAIALLQGPGYNVELANGPYLESVGNRDVLDRPLFAVLPELAAQGLYDLMERVRSTGEPFRGKEMPVQLDFRGDGIPEIRFYDMAFQPLRGAAGAVEGILVHAANVTDGVFARLRIEQQAQEMAARAEERAAIIEQMPSGVIVVDANGRTVLINEVGRRISGGSPDAPLVLAAQTSAYQFREPVTGRPLLPQETPIARAMAGERVEECEYLFRRDGASEDTWISASAVPLRTAGNVRGALSIFSDITSRRRAEEDRDRFFALSQNLLSIASLDGYFVDVNPAFQATLGFTAAEICAEPFLSFVHPDDQAATAVEAGKLAAGELTICFENRYRCKDGSYRWLLWAATPFPEQQRIYCSARDITADKLAAAEVQRHVERLSALRQIDLAITSGIDLRLALDVLLQQVIAMLGIDAADVLLYNPRLQVLEFGAGRGVRDPISRRTAFRLGQGLAGHVALERRLIDVPDLALSDPRMIGGRNFAGEGFVAYFGVPLIAKGEVQGVLELFHRSPFLVDTDWREFLEMLAGQAAIAIDNARLYEGLQRSNTDLKLAYDTTIEGWSSALDLRDKETQGHSRRVTEMTMRLAGILHIGDEELIQIRRGALLHDIGKMGVPDAILLKPGPLSDEEWAQMRKHPTFAYELLAPIDYLRPALDIPYCHHEKWDGSGYPRGLVEEQIPLAARIFAVVDVWDALISDRPYRAAWPGDTASAHILSLAGSHFDPAVVDAFLELMDSEKRMHATSNV